VLSFFSPGHHVEAFPTNNPLSFRAGIGGGLVDKTDDYFLRKAASTSTPTSAALDWSFLDSVYLIHCPNGDTDGTRIKSTKGILGEVNLLDSVVIKEFETDDEDRVRGCYTSHVSVFRDIIENSRQSSRTSSGFNLLDVFQQRNDDSNDDRNRKVLIFEDNVNLSNEVLLQNTIDAVSNFVQNNENQWDVIHLAYIPYVPDLQVSKTNDKRIVKLSTSNKQSALGTTAYIINSRAMKRIVEEDDKNGYTVSIPDAMADLFGESRYALNPTAFVRAPATKSLVNPQLDDLRSILFRPTVVAFVQQILVVTGLSTTVLLPLVILMLILTSISSASSTVQTALEFWNYGTLDGPILFPIINAVFSLFSLAVITQGILLAPPPNDDDS
jgi:GR25 family glycosyltransferase involved in LPS biosynthesis